MCLQLGFSEILFLLANNPNLHNLPDHMGECIHLIGGLVGHFTDMTHLNVSKCTACQMGDLFVPMVEHVLGKLASPVKRNFEKPELF